MALKIMVRYRDSPLVFDVVKHEDNIYQLRLHEGHFANGVTDVPHKIIIRKKGLIWISDVEDHRELVAQLTAEIAQFSTADASPHE